MAIEAAEIAAREELQRACTSVVKSLRAALEEEMACQRSELSRRKEALDRRHRELDQREAELVRRERAQKVPEVEPLSPIMMARLPMTPTPARAAAPTPAPTPSRCMPQSPFMPQLSSRTSLAPMTPPEEELPGASDDDSAPADHEPRLSDTPIGSASQLKAMFEQKAAANTAARQTTVGLTSSASSGCRIGRRTSPPATNTPLAPRMTLEERLQLDKERLDQLNSGC